MGRVGRFPPPYSGSRPLDRIPVSQPIGDGSANRTRQGGLGFGSTLHGVSIEIGLQKAEKKVSVGIAHVRLPCDSQG